MTTITKSTRTTAPTVAVASGGRIRRHRSSRLLWLGVALAVAGALIGFVVYTQAGQREPMIAVARPLAYGQTISEADLRPVSLPADSGLSAVAWSQRSSLLNRPAATDLRAGQVVTADSVLAERLPSAGQAIVGIAVKRGQLPGTPLAPRDAVRVVAAGQSPSATAGVPGAAGVPIDATVLRVSDADSSGLRVVDLLVDEGQAAAVARLAGAGQAVIVVVPRR